jgi:hypothetical protein
MIRQIDWRVGPAMRVKLDARQGQKIIDQARHAPRLLLHDREKARAPLGGLQLNIKWPDGLKYRPDYSAPALRLFRRRGAFHLNREAMSNAGHPLRPCPAKECRASFPVSG